VETFPLKTFGRPGFLRGFALEIKGINYVDLMGNLLL